MPAPGFSQVLSRTAALLLALLVGWQILSLNIANYFTGRASTADTTMLDTALWWDSTQPTALAKRGLHALREGQTELAQAYLQQAAAANPASGRPLVNLALLYASQENFPAGDRLAASAHALEPVEYRTQRDLALYWFSRQQYATAVQHLAVALVGGGAPFRAQFFPVLLDIAAREALRPALQPIAANPQPYTWWPAFFRFAASNAEEVAVLSELVAMREASQVAPLTEDEREAYTGRMRKEGLIAQAYLYWVNGLTQEQLQYLGYLYDGSFEAGLGHSSGFGWVARPPKNSGIRIAIGETYGTVGEQALWVSFRGQRQRFNHLWQNLFLAPGNYVLTGRTRPDKLKARRGLAWRVQCVGGTGGQLAESELFTGTGDWRDFAMNFTVPAGCSGPMLRLYSVGTREVDHEVMGTIWFDDMQIGLQR